MRDILVLSHTHTSFGSEVDVAARLSTLFHAQLTGLFVTEPSNAVTLDPSLRALMDLNMATVRQDAAGATSKFRSYALKRGCSTAHWQIASGSLLETVAQIARWHDLVVIRRDDAFLSSGVSGIGRLLLGLGTPTLVIPQSRRGPIPFERVAIATNDSPESLRALRAAMPLIAAANSVVLWRGDTHESSADAKEAGAAHFSALSYLARHGINVDERPPSTGLSGDELVDAAEDAKADLLVMGAYGRSRVSEWILGGATRSALTRCPMPLFMAH